jgi:hypothetical protein
MIEIMIAQVTFCHPLGALCLTTPSISALLTNAATNNMKTMFVASCRAKPAINIFSPVFPVQFWLDAIPEPAH